MSDINPQEFGRVSADVDELKQKAVVLLTSNSKRKDENISMSERLISMEGSIEELGNALRGQTAVIEGIHDDIADTKTDVSDLRGEVAEIKGIIESRSFNWSKFMSGVLTAKGMALTVIAFVCLTVLGLSITSPESIPAFLNALSDIKK